MVNKYLLGLKWYLMRKVSVYTSKLSRLGFVYKLTAQRYQGSDLRFQSILWKHDNHMIFHYVKQKQNDCSLDLTLLFHHTRGFVLLAYTGKCPHADPAKRTTDKTSSAVKTWFYQNWDRYMCGFLITSTTSDCAIVEKYVSKHVNLVISGAFKTLIECNCRPRQLRWRSADWIQTPGYKPYKHTVKKSRLN